MMHNLSTSYTHIERELDFQHSMQYDWHRCAQLSLSNPKSLPKALRNKLKSNLKYLRNKSESSSKYLKDNSKSSFCVLKEVKVPNIER